MNTWHPAEPPMGARVLALDTLNQCVIARFVDHHIMGKIWQTGPYTYSTNIKSWMPLPTAPETGAEHGT